ncbi:MAG: hypothetical protein IT457_20200 [Planctomycetes bacterium]|nr:hypothetical protein [Planctomycetota bacterium]
MFDPAVGRSLGPGPARCIHCDAPISELRRRLSPVCEAPDCRTHGVLGRLHAVNRREAKHRAEQLAAERDRVLAGLRDAFRDRAAEAERAGTGFLIGVLPANELGVEAVAPDRIELFLERLRGIVVAARSVPVAAASPATEPGEPPLALQRAACGLCRGRCCRSGGNHAYLDEASLARILAAEPSRTEEELFAQYRSFAPSHAYVGACLFQAEDGCALPRELRSDTCNRHLCGELRTLHAEWLASDARELGLGAAADGVLVRTTTLSLPSAMGDTVT